MKRRTSAGGSSPQRNIPHFVSVVSEQDPHALWLAGIRRAVLVSGSVIGLLTLAVVLSVATGCAYQVKPPPATRTQQPNTATVTPSPAPTTPAPEAVQPTPTVAAATATAEPGGRNIVLTPVASGVGWWSSGDTRANHLGDSFLYSGYFDGQVFASAMTFDLRSVPRGAPLRQASLQLTGLRDDRFARAAGGAWTVQFLDPAAFTDLGHVSFQTLFNQQPSVTLFPVLEAAALSAQQTNVFTLDASARDWLAAQLLNGSTTLLVRITGPAGGDNTLFAWDSGAGNASSGAVPQLALSVGAIAATPPPLPTRSFVVATLTPTPANILTAAVYAQTATAIAQQASAGGVAQIFVTPTPAAPLVFYTPTPANEATAAANAAYATAVAFTTGTFTPIPPGAVTPVVVAPTPRAENVMTAAVQMLAATAQAKMVGTVTPLPYNVIIATLTATPALITSTPRPLNEETAVAYSVYATAVALTTGTFTPVPRDAMTPTPPLVTPLVVYVDQLPPTPVLRATPTPGARIPSSLVGTILFYSDRTGFNQLYSYNPVNGRLAYVTQEWPYTLQLRAESHSPDGTRSVIVSERQDTESRQLGVYMRDNASGALHLLMLTKGIAYDPVWSPRGDLIAFVSNDSGNDEIYIVNPDSSNLRRLTNNTWEWDKHPSWSPDGSQIVFWSNRDSGRQQLWVMNADGSDQHKLIDSTSNDFDPEWAR
jgi:hypothetical protein